MFNRLQHMYATRDDDRVVLRIKIANGALAVTDISVNDTVVKKGIEGHVELDLGEGSNLNGAHVQCYTYLDSQNHDLPNRADYFLNGGVEDWSNKLDENPPDPARDLFYASLYFYTV